MIVRDLVDLETREDLKSKAVNTVAPIKYTVHKNVETVKDSAAHAEQEGCNVIKDFHEKSEDVKKYIKLPKIFRRNLINL